MDGYALLREWPAFGKANAETLFASPAWRMSLAVEEKPMVLTKATEPAEDLLWVSVAFEDETHTLGIGDAAAYADLHLLWSRRNALPEEVLLALVERECGVLFQSLESVFRRQLRLVGLTDRSGTARRVDFELASDGEVARFALDLSPLLVMELGRLRHLDPGHGAIRALRRPAWVEHAVLDLLDAECAVLAAGDCLVLPEDAQPVWRVATPEDDLAHVRSERAGELTFAQMADEDWPAFPEPGPVVLLRGGCRIARGVLATLGLRRILKIEEVFDHV